MAGWTDRITQLASPAVNSLADQWAQDRATLWWGESKDATTGATGVSRVRYQVTQDRVVVVRGARGTHTESVPLRAVEQVHVRQAAWQRGKDVGDVVLTLDGTAEAVPGSTTSSRRVVLDRVVGPFSLVDLLRPLVAEARSTKSAKRQPASEQQMLPPVFVPRPADAVDAAPDVAEQLRMLAELREAGVLADEEFAMQKARLLGA